MVENHQSRCFPACYDLDAGGFAPPRLVRAMVGAYDLKDRRSARIAIVEEHIRLENEHDLEGVLRTFGENATYDDEPWGEHYHGRDGVRRFYDQLLKALPDIEIAVQHRYVAEDAVLVEV